jgi:hemerythrin-like metal-binding protein
MPSAHRPPTEPIAFDTTWQIGLPEIDRQHLALVAQLNQLITNEAADLPSPLMSEVLSRLGRDLVTHFQHEERQFALIGLPADLAAAHVAAHNAILSEYVGLNFELMRPHDHSRGSVLVLLRSWITDHITTFDLRLKDFAAH